MTEIESPLIELRKLVIAQKTALLPPEAPNDALQQVHSALLEYDLLISQAVIAAIQQRPIEVPIEVIRAARAAAQQALDRPGIPAGREVAGYQNYKQRLDRMADLIDQVERSQQ